MPRLVIDARTVRPGMTGVGYWAMEITKAVARIGAQRGDWDVTALTLATHPGRAGRRPGTPSPSASHGKGFPFIGPFAGDPLTPTPHRLAPRVEDELDRIEHSWNETPGLLRVPVQRDYQSHPDADLWFHGGGLGRLLKDLGADLFFSPTFLSPLRAPCPRIATLLDFIAWRFPSTYPTGFRYYVRMATRLAVKRSNGLVAISQSVRKDARKLLQVPKGKLRVIHPGIGPEFRPVPDGELVAVRTAYNLPPPPYFIWVGAIEKRKDLPTLLRAFEDLTGARGGGRSGKMGRGGPPRERDGKSGAPRGLAEGKGSSLSGTHPEASLLIVGRRAPGGEDAVARLQRSPARSSIRWLADLPRGVLAAALAGAAALVYPSRYEGFGLPVAEAMACGTPVIAARTSSIPEVAGDDALLVAPGDARAFREAMERLLDFPDLAAELSTQGLARSVAFRWDRSASLFLDFADKVLNRT